MTRRSRLYWHQIQASKSIATARCITGTDLIFEKADITSGSGTLHFSPQKPSGSADQGKARLVGRFWSRADDATVALQNTGESVLKPTVTPPVIRNLRIGTLSDTWFLFPKYRNVISNQQDFTVARNGPGVSHAILRHL